MTAEHALDGAGNGSGARVWLLRTPSHDRLVLAEQQSPGKYMAAFPVNAAGNYSASDVTEAVREFITLNPEWARNVLEPDNLAAMRTEVTFG
jgi:hypothetical protein